MRDNKILFFLLLLTFSSEIKAQQEEFTSQPTKHGEYSLVAYVSGGLGFYPSYGGTLAYLQPKISNINPVATLRLMWHPDNLLKVGLETGYMTFLSYTIKDSADNTGKVLLTATPLLLEWSMAITKRINVFAGAGLYFMHANLDYAGKTTSQKLSIGWMAAASYIHPLSKNLGLGTEVKWLDAAESRDGSICLQLQLVWKFLRW